jgi:hypothetical protein
MITDNQKGVSLIITFFIMIIILLIVSSISALLYSEVKVIKNMSNSVSAFYAADSGAERVLYYDGKVIPTGAARGICDICNACPTCFDSGACSRALPLNYTDANGCTNCTECNIVFKTTIPATPLKFYNANVVVAKKDPLPGEGCPISTAVLQSYGTYLTAKRAINLNIPVQVKTGLGPDITDKSVWFTGGHEMHIEVHVSECKRNLDSVTAYISNNQNSDIVELELSGGNNGNCDSKYDNTWSDGITGFTYYVSIGAINNNGYCASTIADSIYLP